MGHLTKEVIYPPIRQFRLAKWRFRRGFIPIFAIFLFTYSIPQYHVIVLPGHSFCYFFLRLAAHFLPPFKMSTQNASPYHMARAYLHSYGTCNRMGYCTFIQFILVYCDHLNIGRFRQIEY